MNKFNVGDEVIVTIETSNSIQESIGKIWSIEGRDSASMQYYYKVFLPAGDGKMITVRESNLRLRQED